MRGKYSFTRTCSLCFSLTVAGSPPSAARKETCVLGVARVERLAAFRSSSSVALSAGSSQVWFSQSSKCSRFSMVVHLSHRRFSSTHKCRDKDNHCSKQVRSTRSAPFVSRQIDDICSAEHGVMHGDQLHKSITQHYCLVHNPMIHMHTKQRLSPLLFIADVLLSQYFHSCRNFCH